MSHKYGSSLVPGAHHYGRGGLGALVSLIPQSGEVGAGYLANEAADPANAGKEIRGLILTVPNSGIFTVGELSEFTLTSASDGIHTFTYQVYLDGVDGGIGTGTIIVGVAAMSGSTSMGNYSASGTIIGSIDPYILTPPYRNESLVPYPPGTVIPWVHVLLCADGTSVYRELNVVLDTGSQARLSNVNFVSGVLYQVASSTPDGLLCGMEPVLAI